MRSVSIIVLFNFMAFTSCFYEVKMMKELVTERPDENIIFSPLSIFQIVSLVSNGAVGETRKQLLLVIDQSNVNEANKKNEILKTMLTQSKSISVENAVLTKFTPKEDFIRISKEYQAEVTTLQDAKQVGELCNEKTKGKIPHIYDENDDNVKMKLINVVSFKGKWLMNFNPADTYPQVFHSPKKDQTVQMMHLTLYANYYEGDSVKIIELPYEDEVSALIMLPSQDIDTFIKELNETTMSLSSLKLQMEKVILTLPKFELRYTTSLVNTFNKLGATVPFDPAIADFSNIAEQMELFIGAITHKAYMKFDENGTEAIALTSMDILDGCLSEPNEERAVVMTVDKPFIVIIQHKNLHIPSLFFAKVASIEEP